MLSLDMKTNTPKNNHYWTVYKNLESEVLSLANVIYFDDNQLNVYSIKIAELLVRCVIEIESISKELYFANGGTVLKDDEGKERHLLFDADCLSYLEKLWKLSKKEVNVVAANFYFSKPENMKLTPLHKANKRGSSSAIWNKAYQAVKHNRAGNLDKATIKSLIHAMAALYALNIYFRSEKFTSSTVGFDTSLGSSVFSVTYCNMTGINGDDNDNRVNDTSICVLKYHDSTYKSYLTKQKEELGKMKEMLTSSQEYLSYINAGQRFTGKNLVAICGEIGSWNFANKAKVLASFEERKKFLENSQEYKYYIGNNSQCKQEITEENFDKLCSSVGAWHFQTRIVFNNQNESMRMITKTSFEVILNKHQRIYPELETK